MCNITYIFRKKKIKLEYPDLPFQNNADNEYHNDAG